MFHGLPAVLCCKSKIRFASKSKIRFASKLRRGICSKCFPRICWQSSQVSFLPICSKFLFCSLNDSGQSANDRQRSWTVDQRFPSIAQRQWWARPLDSRIIDDSLPATCAAGLSHQLAVHRARSRVEYVDYQGEQGADPLAGGDGSGCLGGWMMASWPLRIPFVARKRKNLIAAAPTQRSSSSCQTSSGPGMRCDELGPRWNDRRPHWNALGRKSTYSEGHCSVIGPRSNALERDPPPVYSASAEAVRIVRVVEARPDPVQTRRKPVRAQPVSIPARRNRVQSLHSRVQARRDRGPAQPEFVPSRSQFEVSLQKSS